MKQIAPNYTYNNTTGVIILVDVNIDRDQLLLIVNTTRNVTYYNFADSATTLQAFTRGVNTSFTLNSAVITASSAHANSDSLVIYYDDQESASKIINELPYIKVNVNVVNASTNTLTSNVYLRKTSEYTYESIRYQGGEDEAYLKLFLDNGDESTQRVWRLYSNGAYAEVQGIVANALPQNAGSNNGDALPPKTGWTLETGITGTLSISYEQPATQPISGTVNASLASENDFVVIGEEIAQGINNQGTIPISGTVTSLAGGETPTLGTATLTNDTRWELDTEGFGHIAFEIVSSGVTWSANGVSAQAYNGTAPSNVDILAPAGIRYRHSTDTSVAPTSGFNNAYFNLAIAPLVGNSYGTNLIRVDGSNSGSLALPATGTRYFLFDLTTSRFALRPFFSAGTVTVKYRLYRGKHPFFSARNIITTGEGSAGAVKVEGTVSLNGGNVYLDGGYLDDTSSIEYAVGNSLSGWASNLPQISVQSGRASVNTYPTQGTTATNTNFSSATSATLASAVSTREVLTVHNEGPATLFINVGASASATLYQVRLLAGDYWEAPAGQQSLQHSGIFSSAGSVARVTEIS